MTKNVGRPPLSNWDKYQISHKLEPYLKLGVSVRKACIQSGVPSSTVYKYMQIDSEFMDIIRRFQVYYSVLVSGSVMRLMQRIIKKQEAGIELSGDDLKFLMWLATHHKSLSEEYIQTGSKVEHQAYDPEHEYRRIVRYIDEFCSDTPNAMKN